MVKVVRQTLAEIILADEAATSGIYCILNIVNGKLYIGSTEKSLENRFRQHKWYLRANRHPNNHLQAAWNKYGETAFKFVILKKCTPDRCIELEQECIDGSKSFKPEYGYNICPRAGNTEGVRVSQQTKDKIAAKQRGKRLSAETRQKMSNIRKGVKHSQRHQEAVNAALRSPKVRAKMSKGIKYSKSGEAKLRKLYA